METVKTVYTVCEMYFTAYDIYDHSTDFYHIFIF